MSGRTPGPRGGCAHSVRHRASKSSGRSWPARRTCLAKLRPSPLGEGRLDLQPGTSRGTRPLPLARGRQALGLSYKGRATSAEVARSLCPSATLRSLTSASGRAIVRRSSPRRHRRPPCVASHFPQTVASQMVNMARRFKRRDVWQSSLQTNGYSTWPSGVGDVALQGEEEER